MCIIKYFYNVLKARTYSGHISKQTQQEQEHWLNEGNQF